MRLMPASYNDFLFQQINRVASDFQTPYDWTIQGITTSDIPRSNNFPLRVAKNYTGAIKVVNVNLLDVDFTRDDLVIAMDVLGEEQSQLIAKDEFGRSWYVNADFIGLTEDTNSGKTASFGAVFAVDDPIWKKLIPSTFTIDTDISTTGTITPIGNQPALPIITVTPAGGSNGFIYKRFITIVNNSPNALLNYPLDITNGGLDTAALVASNKMLASGDDCRIYIDGVDVKRWPGDGGFDNASTTIWVNWTQGANSQMTTGSSIAASGAITNIQIAQSAENIALFPSLPASGLVLIDSEIFAYTGRAFALAGIKGMYLTGITRAERQTTEAAHSSGATMEFIRDVWLYYGYASIAPYVVDDTNKPLLDLVNSTNGLHIYADLFKDAAGNRSGAWEEVVTVLTSNFPNSHNYYGPEDVFADPATVIGTYIEGISILGWKLYEPCGATDIEVTGQGFTTSTRFSTLIESSFNGIDYVHNVHIFTAPTPPSTWQPITSGSQALGDTYFYIRMRSHSNIASLVQYAELTDAEITLDATLTPTITLAAEDGGFITLHPYLYNYLTDELLEFEIALAFGNYIVINTRNKTATLYDGTNAITALIDMPLRPQWFQLLPQQENEIEIYDASTTVFLFEWEDRAL